MWDDEGFETSESVRETVDWMDELRRKEVADRALPEPSESNGFEWMFTGARSAAARLRPEHTLTWACAELVREARQNCADVTFENEAALIAHVRSVVALDQTEWAPGAAIFQDQGDDNSLAYYVVLCATPDEIAAVVAS